MTMRVLVFGLAFAGAAFSSCSSTSSVSMPAPLREKFSPTYHTHIVSADQRKTYDAAKAALKMMDFRFEKGGPAQGKLTAISGLSRGDDMRGSRQLSLEVKLTPVTEGTEIAALFSEIREDDFNKSPGMGTSTSVRESGIYEAFFQHVHEALTAAAK